jgi:hypothetical protein
VVEGGPTSAPVSQPVVFTPAKGDAAQQTVNIQLVFDSSGSMAEDIGGETKITAARRAMERVIEQLDAANPNLNVGFRVFGHQGDNTEAGKAVSCQSTELLVPVSGVNKDLLRQQTNAWEPTGWTPISLALQRAGEDLQAGENVRNVIIMVTDGEETCAGDPCAVAKALAASEAEVRIDVVGFGLAPEVADTLKCIGENSGGVYIDAQNGNALQETLPYLIEATVARGRLIVESLGPDGQATNLISLLALENEQGNYPENESGTPVRPMNLDGSPETVNELTDNGATMYELAPGTYSFYLSYGFPPDIGRHAFYNREDSTYTAVVESGKDTRAVVGIGSLTVRNAANLSTELHCNFGLAVQKPSSGNWEEAVPGYTHTSCSADAALPFDKPYLLPPGKYRLLDHRGIKVTDEPLIGTEFTIEPGKAVEVQIKQRGG